MCGLCLKVCGEGRTQGARGASGVYRGRGGHWEVYRGHGWCRRDQRFRSGNDWSTAIICLSGTESFRPEKFTNMKLK